MTTAGRHHRVCVATSRRPHPHILESGLARSPPLPIILCVYTSAHHFRWIRANRGAGPPPDRGVRLDWTDMPGHVRNEVERWLGGTVVGAVTQPTGFSPGVAARLTTDGGRRVFCKAVGPEPNAVTPKMHRREVSLVTALPGAAPVPRLLWSYDEGEGGWVVLVFEDVDGRHPTQPWRIDELDRVVSAMGKLSMVLTPSPLPAAMTGTAGDAFVRGWRRLHEERPSRLEYVDEWTPSHRGVGSDRGDCQRCSGGRYAPEQRPPGRQHPAHARVYLVR